MSLKKSSQKVEAFLQIHNIPAEIMEFQETTKTSHDAAKQIGCKLGQIAKSLIFQKQNTNELILIVASGKNMVDTQKVEKIINDKIKRADPTFIKQETGFVIGGVPPFAHNKKLETILDKDLENYEEIWAAAGTPNSVFRLTPIKLQQLTKAKFQDIKKLTQSLVNS